MKKKRLNKRAENEGGNTVVGLVLLALVLVAVIYITTKYGGELISWINNKVKKWAGTVFNADSLYTKASGANFDRLNDELDMLLKSNKNTEHIIIPYTLGQFWLIGFNKDPYNTINNECIGEERLNLLPDKCKKASCLCHCYAEENCECEAYPEVDYFITTKGQFRNKGDMFNQIQDPITGEEAYCLQIKGSANNELTGLTLIEPYDNWWRSNMVYIEKIEHEGKRYIFFSRFQDIEFTERMYGEACKKRQIKDENCPQVLSCSDYKVVDLGCDWRSACQSNICEDSGLSCNVRENPYAQEGEETQYCLSVDESLGDFCTAGNAEESVPLPGIRDELYWEDGTGICFRCLGLGQPGADSWGWGQDSTINKDNCR